MRIMLGISTLIAAAILAGCGSDPKVDPADLVFSGGGIKYCSGKESPCPTLSSRCGTSF